MRKLICFDIEATGLNTVTDRIVSIAMQGEGVEESWLINPGVHGITNERVEGLAGFDLHAKKIYDIVRDSDLLGFNISNFDIPLLWEEFHRCGIEWDLSATDVINAGVLFKRREERTLAAAVQFYCGFAMTGAHDAECDVLATWEVFRAQLARYKLIGATREQLVKESSFDEVRVDLAGKIVLNKDSKPVYNIGKAKGCPVVDDPGFGRWMLDRDFSENTKMHLRKLLYAPVSVVERDSDAPF